MKKRILSMLLVITMIVTMMPTVTLAAEPETETETEANTETFGTFTVTTTSGAAITVATYEESTKVLKITGDCTIANTDPNTPTNDTISIESDCTVSLDGVNIEAKAPDNRNDISNSNPISINDACEVTIKLASDKINTLGFTASTIPDSDNINIKLGSGKAGLHVPSGSTLTIDGTGTLNSTGAEGFNAWASYARGGGGAGIGGDGRRTYEELDAEASGTIVIKNGTINAKGGNSTGYWGGGGAGIGGGGGAYQYLGGDSGTITIEGGNVTATGGNPGTSGGCTGGSGIGSGGKGGNCYNNATTADVILNGGSVVASGYYGVQGKSITISGESTRLDAEGVLQALSSEPTTSDIGRIVSYTGGCWNDANTSVQVFTDIDPDIAKVEVAKTAITTAISNLTVSNATIDSDILTAAQNASLHGVTVEWDLINGFYKTYATSSANGSVTGTLKLTLNEVSDTVTVNKIITQLSLSDAEKIKAAKTAITTAISNLTVSNATIDSDILIAAQNASLHGVTVGWNIINGFNKTNATSSADGSVTGTLKLTLNEVSDTVTVNKIITQLPLSEAEKVEAAKTAITTAISNLTVSNTTMDSDILTAAQIASLHGVTVEWDLINGFNKTNATSSANGSVTGTLKLTLNEVSDTVTVNKIITQLPLSDAEKIEAAKTAITTAISNLTVSNATIDSDILTIARNASLHGVTVAWDTTKGFNKTNATSTATGTIQGTIILSLGSVTCTVEVNKTIKKLSFDDGGSSSDNNSGSTPVKTEGKVEKDQKQDENAPVTRVNDSNEDLKSKVLSAEDLAQVATGNDAKIILKVKDISTSVSEEDKIKIEEKLAEGQQNTAKAELLYIDISLFKKIGEGQETRVTKTSGKISISIEIPKDMRSTIQGVDRTYSVIRIHNGVADRLSGTYDKITNLFIFETDQFSTYALTYKDVNTTTDKLTVYNDFYHLRLKAEGAKTSQKLSYAKVSGADGYLIYGAKCGQSLKKIADVKGTVLSYTVNKLKQAIYYKYQVKAYKIIDGKQVIISTSKVVHSITEDKTYANPTKVTTDVTSVKLSVGNTKTLTCQVVLPKDKKMKKHTAITRYESTNKEIATVNSKGKITAKGKGTCYVYVYAQNGIYVKIKITVK